MCPRVVLIRAVPADRINLHEDGDDIVFDVSMG